MRETSLVLGLVAVTAYAATQTANQVIFRAGLAYYLAAALLPLAIGAAVFGGRAAGRPATDPRLALRAGLSAAGVLLALGVLGRLVVPRPLGLGSLLPTIVLLTAIAAVALAAGAVLGTRLGRPLRTGELLLLEVAALMLATDYILIRTRPLNDLEIYLRAGDRFRAGLSVYLQAPIRIPPHDGRLLPFLYPPPTLPFFGLLSVLPRHPVIVAWEVGLFGAAVAGFRLLGLRWRWVALAVIWPPFVHGLWSGNVALFAFLLLAAGARVGPALPISAIFKLQAAIPSLWLVLERRWTAIAGGIATLIALAVVTLPVVGPESWLRWIDGLLDFQRSSLALIGYALPRYVPTPVFYGLALAAVGLALTQRSLRGLAAFGLAAVVASPSLYDHGFLALYPALLTLNAGLLWTGVALTSVLTGPGWWMAVGLAAAAFVWPRLAHDGVTDAAVHPLGGAMVPWSLPAPGPSVADVAGHLGRRLASLASPERVALTVGPDEGAVEAAEQVPGEIPVFVDEDPHPGWPETLEAGLAAADAKAGSIGAEEA